MRWLSEYILKGIFLGLLAFVALQESGWPQTDQVALFTLLGLAVSVAVAAWLKLREGYQVGGRVPGFILFALLESPRVVYGGIILGLAIGAFSIRKASSETLFTAAFIAGGLLGVVLLVSIVNQSLGTPGRQLGSGRGDDCRSMVRAARIDDVPPRSGQSKSSGDSFAARHSFLLFADVRRAC
jgi:hypothetical protein